MNLKNDNDKIEKWYEFNLDIDNRTIYFGAWQDSSVECVVSTPGAWEVNDVSAQNIIKGLYLLNKNKKAPIKVIWFSYGGDWNAGMAIYDFIRNIESSVTIEAYGRIRSMGTIILQAAKKRLLSQSCLFLIHYGEDASDPVHSKNYIEHAEYTKRVNAWMEDIYLKKIREKHKKYTREKLQDLMKYDKYMTPQEAIDLGLADEIIK